MAAISECAWACTKTSDDYCADDGVIMLQACGDKETIDKMIAAFSAVEGVTAKLIDLRLKFRFKNTHASCVFFVCGFSKTYEISL